ncbi:MAG: type II/IV secretion system protein [Parcubacteria group bacterium]|nr:type II/IV secretion system protein [Parcubacteria group bacterium]
MLSIPNKTFYEMVEKGGLVPAKDLKTILGEAEKNKTFLGSLLVSRNLMAEDQLAEMIAQYHKVEYVDLTKKSIDRSVLELVPESIARTYELIAFERQGRNVSLAMLDPKDLTAIDFIKKKTGFTVKPYLTTEKALETVLASYRVSLRAEFDHILKESAKESKASTGASLEEVAVDIPIVRVVDTLIRYAVFEDASDIHIEPSEKFVLVRYRIDGVLREMLTLPREIHPAVVARIKILSNLKIDEHRLPQDGRIKVETKEFKISLRVSTIPIFDGEKIVMRILDEEGENLDFEQLGFIGNLQETIERSFKRPHGMILVTGPTGSGKTTTLYTALKQLNTPKVNISTVEDPIEYRMERVNQIQVNPKIGLTFAMGLRALLRQDPNIIMVGEIRDQETADIAINAALTGHLVLSTLHTNNAPTALPRLLDMHVEPFLISSTVNVIIGQRLVRKICRNCIESYTLSKEAITELKKQIDVDHILYALKKANAILTEVESLESLLFYRGKGCEQCGNTGYKGRIGIYEILEVTDTIRALILKRVSSDEITQAALKEGMLVMAQDGFIKAKSGVTTIEEVLRVTKE